MQAGPCRNKSPGKCELYAIYYRNYGWYGGAYAYNYGYSGCAWLRQQALITGIGGTATTAASIDALIAASHG